jgi:oxygen-independent coproporphyrinogen-3 oxidase
LGTDGFVIGAVRSAYVHIPFCVSKCWYCDFNSYCGLQSQYEEYVRALIAEINSTTPCSDDALQTVYFGGGTPTVLPEDDLIRVLDTLRERFGILDAAEVTSEANPGTVSLRGLRMLREGGFNRISLGIQSLDDDFLRSIGRTHTRLQAMTAYNYAREAGFDNVGVDLIFALPGQTLLHWADTLETVIELNPRPEHVSLYELSIEEGTRFAELCAEGKLREVGEELRLEMYEYAIERLTRAGYEHYEVSNFALPGFWSQHNLTYWRNEPYYGFGAGATSYLNGTRSRRVSDPRRYIEAAESGSDLMEFSETLSPTARLGETIIQGLRMLEGVGLNYIQTQTGLDPRSVYQAEIESLSRRGLIEVTNDHLRVTHAGLLLLNDVSQEFAVIS